MPSDDTETVPKPLGRTCSTLPCPCRDCENNIANVHMWRQLPLWTDPCYQAEVDDTTLGEAD